MYEAFPYPAYPLFLKLRYQEAYQGTASFAAKLSRCASLHFSQEPKVLVAGCGETQPYILRKIEPRRHSMDAVDISKRSIKRAQLRLLWNTKPIHFAHEDLDRFLVGHQNHYDHIDCYGVLHHLANPRQSLEKLFLANKAGGTLRIMVYNQESRHWIFHIKRALNLLGFSAETHREVRDASKFLRGASFWLPNIEDRLKSMGEKTLNNPSRFVDTFFHSREAKLPLRDWFQACKDSGYQILGIFDRYAELDDLPNPLWHPPKLEDLEARVADRRFENNFEIYLQKKQNISLLKNQNRPMLGSLTSYIKTYPRSWFQYEETRDIPILLRQKLWWHHLSCTNAGPTSPVDMLLSQMDIKARQRLARIGSILPTQVKRDLYKDQLIEAMCPNMEAPIKGKETQILDTPLPQMVREILLKNQKPLSHEKLVIERLKRAQSV